MNEWSIMVVRLQTILGQIEAAYDHGAILPEAEAPEAQAIMRAIWSSRGEIRDALPKARELRDATNATLEQEITSGK